MTPEFAAGFNAGIAAARNEIDGIPRTTGSNISTWNEAWYRGISAALDAISALTVPSDLVAVPREPNEAMWGNKLVRTILMWLTSGETTPKQLFFMLDATGVEIPRWLKDETEMKALTHSVSKGTCAVIVFRAMIAATEERG